MRRAEDKEFAIKTRAEGTSRQSWLYGEIRSAVLGGQLQKGARLPPSRDIARQHSVARGTVQAVYAQLIAEGYLVGKVGKGTFVSESLPSGTRLPQSSRVAMGGALGRLSKRGAMLANTPFAVAGRPNPARVFRPNQPDLKLFPFALWNRIAARRARLSQRSLLADGEAKGYLPLRESIAERIRYSLRIDACPEQIFILGSVQQTFDLCSRLLLDSGDPVWMEDPGYPGARRIFESNGAMVIGVPVDEDGMDVEAGIELAPEARLAYVTPSRQTPLGMPLSLDRRLALLNWAKKANAVVIEDDYDSEYRFLSNPLPALKSLDAFGRVIYAGTFSKLLCPSLRLSYAVVPDWLIDPFAAALSLTCRHMSLLPQVVLHEFMAEGHFGRHIRHMRTVYGERAEQFQQAVTSRLDGLLTIPPITSGIDTAALLPDGADDDAIAKFLADAGIETRPLSAYRVSAVPAAGLVMGFAPFDRNEIISGVGDLARQLECVVPPGCV
ncbi:MAG TPA: PLP-dependent aminotransferase family protein [Rhodocyclaceae bacterium]